MGTHPIFESDFDCLTDSRNMDGMLIIGQSTTWPTDIYVKKFGQTLRAVRVTNFEKLDSAELRELSEEILIQRKVDTFETDYLKQSFKTGCNMPDILSFTN